MIQDLRYAVRTLIANRGFTLVAVLTLAFGIGANTAIFSVVNAVLLKPLPYPNADQLVAIWETRPNILFDRIATSGPDFEDWRSQTKSFAALTAFEGQSLTLTGRGEPQTLDANAVATNAFDFIGVPALLGRTFREGDERQVILSHTLWQERFNSDPNVVGSGLTLDDVAYTVIGVMPRGFDFPPSLAMAGRDLMFNTKLWTVLDLTARRNLRGSKSIFVFGRLRDGTSVAVAQAEMEAVARRSAEQYPAANQGMGILVRPLLESVVRNAQPALLVLLGSVGLVLVIACANVANLQLARATRKDAGGGKSSARQGIGNVFIVVEVALAAVLLIAAGLLTQTFVRLQRLDLGFNPSNLAALHLTLPSSKYPVGRRTAFYEEVLARIPSAAVSSAIPLGDSMTAGGFSIEGRELAAPGRLNPVTRINVSADYLRTMEMPVVRGRDFSTADREGSMPVAIINEELARRYWPGAEPIGQRVKFGRPDAERPWFTVVGISRNVRSFTLQQNMQPEIYVPYGFAPPADAYIIVRASAPMPTTSLLRTVITEIDPNQPVEITTMEALFTRSVAQPRLRMLLLTSFAAIALVLAAVGIYGVMSYFVNERIRDDGGARSGCVTGEYVLDLHRTTKGKDAGPRASVATGIDTRDDD